MENILFLSYLTFKIILFNMQKDLRLAKTAIVFDKLLCWNQGSNSRSLGRFFETPLNRLAAYNSKPAR